MVRTGKPWSIGSGRPFIAMARIASRSSVSAASGVPHVQPSSEVCSTASAPVLDAGQAEQVGDPDAAPPGVADQVAADLVGDAVERHPRLGHLVPDQVLVGQHHLAVDHAVDPELPVGGLDGGDDDRGVDPVEVVGRDHPRRDARQPDPRALRDPRRGDPGQPEQPTGLLDVPSTAADGPPDDARASRRPRRSRRSGSGRYAACGRRRPRRPPRPRPPEPPPAPARGGGAGR